MDLERCPKCGGKWVAGFERCTECGFVPIGAGLKHAPKKKKRKAGKYVEPGSSRGFLFTIFLGLLAFGCYRYQPWRDDWEMVRAWFGQGRHHSVVGEWEIVKTLSFQRDKPVIISQRGIDSGLVNFSKKGSVKMVFSGQSGKATANGKYEVKGLLVAMNNLSSSSAIVGIPKSMQMRLAWTGPNQVVASLGNEAVYMRRKPEKGSGFLQLMKYGLSNGKSGEAPGAMRGVIATMQDNVEKAGE